MSMVRADFGDVNITVATQDEQAFDIYRILQQSFSMSGMAGVDATIKEKNLGEFISFGPAKGLSVEKRDFAFQ